MSTVAAKPEPRIRFKAELLRPQPTGKSVTWTFLLLPGSASTKLPTRGMAAVEGTLNGAIFLAVLEPDGDGGHWLKVDRKLREAAGAVAGDEVALDIVPTDRQPEPGVPPDLKKALANEPQARAVWTDITTIARRDWIHWIVSARKPETRLRRIESACSMLASGKRRVCCFDRSGMYSKSLCAPKVAMAKQD